MNNKNIEYKIETKAGLKIAKYINDEITVKMGVPILESQNIPTTIEKISIQFLHMNLLRKILIIKVMQ